MKISLDCHSPRLISNNCNLPDWPNFSLLSTLKKRNDINDITKEKDKYELRKVHTFTPWHGLRGRHYKNPRSSDRTFYKCILKHILITFFREDQDDHWAGGSYDANVEQRVQVGPCVSSSYPCWYLQCGKLGTVLLKDRDRYLLFTQFAGLKKDLLFYSKDFRVMYLPIWRTRIIRIRIHT